MHLYAVAHICRGSHAQAGRKEDLDAIVDKGHIRLFSWTYTKGRLFYEQTQGGRIQFGYQDP